MDLTRYLGCLGLIKPEVDLIRTILRTSSRLDNRWVLTESGECDALLVYNTDKSFAPFVLKPATQLIMIKRRGEPFNGRVFYKPFRADELVDTLVDIQSSDQSQLELAAPDNNQVQVSFYRLKKWPPAEILSRHKNYMLLAVYLSRGAKTLQDLITLSGQGEVLCANFLRVLQEYKLLHVDAGGAGQVIRASQGTSARTDEKKSFFSMLKTRLGLNKK